MHGENLKEMKLTVSGLLCVCLSRAPKLVIFFCVRENHIVTKSLC